MDSDQPLNVFYDPWIIQIVGSVAAMYFADLILGRFLPFLEIKLRGVLPFIAGICTAVIPGPIDDILLRISAGVVAFVLSLGVNRLFKTTNDIGQE
jgi:hypothetical protein